MIGQICNFNEPITSPYVHYIYYVKLENEKEYPDHQVITWTLDTRKLTAKM